jgi:hypothetical protein
MLFINFLLFNLIFKKMFGYRTAQRKARKGGVSYSFREYLRGARNRRRFVSRYAPKVLVRHKRRKRASKFLGIF